MTLHQGSGRTISLCHPSSPKGSTMPTTAVRLVALVLTCIGLSSIPGCATTTPTRCGEPVTTPDLRSVTLLADDLSPLREQFNASSDRWRVVSLVSPTCSECILGTEAVAREIASRYPASQVAVLTVWIPMLPTDNESAAKASATLLAPDRANQFYDSRQQLGSRVAQQTFAGFYARARKSLPDDHWLATALDDRIEQNRPQWDLYMLYAPGVQWDESNIAPPMPTHWIRHLGRMDDRRTSTYWQDTPESGPREGDLFEAIRSMADNAIGPPIGLSAAFRVEVLGFEVCPNTAQTKRNVEEAVAKIGLIAEVVYVDQERLLETDRRRGWPAPTVLVDGRDLFGMAEPASAAMGCRMYAGGAPTVDEIAVALRVITRSR